MLVKFYYRSFLSASALLLYLCAQCCGRGAVAKIVEKPSDKNSTDQLPAPEARGRTTTSDVQENMATASAASRRGASDTTTTLQQDLLAPFSPPPPDVETTNESSSHCEKARLCSLNDDRRPGRCSCHSHCHLFGDCCEDAVQANHSNIAGSILPRAAYSCYLCNSPFAKAVNIITSCPGHYNVEAVVKACNRSRIFWEPDTNLDSLSTPVTDGSTGLTFGNVFCAICWDANPRTSELWMWNFYCNGNKTSNETSKKILASFPSVHEFTNLGKNGLSTLTYLRNMCESSFVPPRKFSAPFTECDPTDISTCPASFDPTDRLVRLCHNESFQRVYYNKRAYKNVHCLNCNHNLEDRKVTWSCLPPLDIPTSQSKNFVILVSPSAESCDVNQRFSQWTDDADDLCSRLARCIARDRQSIKCIGVCPLPVPNQEGKCSALNATSLCGFDEIPDESTVACSYWSLFLNDVVIVRLNATSAMCYSCALDSFENYTTANGSFAVIVNGTSRIYYSVLTYVKEGVLSSFFSEPAITTISPMENDGTGCSSHTLHWGVPLTTLLLSQCCMIVYCALYGASKRLRCFMGEIVLNQSIAFFLGFAFFAFRWMADHSRPVCKPLNIFMHYFYTVAFSWTSLFAIEVARALSAVVSIIQSSRVNRRRVAYYLVGWGLPLVPVLLGVVADELDFYIQPSYGTGACFYGNYYGFLVFVAIPMCVCQAIDVIVYVYAILRLIVLERQTRMVRETRREKLLLSVKLLCAIGLPWAFAVAASFTDADWVRCSFKVTSSLQGTFILLIYGIKRDVLASLKCCLPPPASQVAGQNSSGTQATQMLPSQTSVLSSP